MRLVILLEVFLPLARAADPDALAIYKQADYDRAIPLLEAAAPQQPDNAEVAAALLSAVVYKGELHKAVDLARADQDNFPKSPEMQTALGEYKLYWGDVFAAERLFKTALQTKELARTDFGLSRIAQMSSDFRTSRILVMRAHLLDPDDARITRDFLACVPPDKRRQELATFVPAHPWLYTKEYRDWVEAGKNVAPDFRDPKFFEPYGDPAEVTLKLHALSDGKRTYGMGLKVTLPSGRVALLQLDTGVSGLLLRQGIFEKEGLDHLDHFDIGGQDRPGAWLDPVSVARTCDVEGIRFGNLPSVVTRTEVKRFRRSGRTHRSRRVPQLSGDHRFAANGTAPEAASEARR